MKTKKQKVVKERKIKSFRSTIRFSVDGLSWSPAMTTFDFIKKCPAQVKCVEVTEVMSKAEVLKLFPNYLSTPLTSMK